MLDQLGSLGQQLREAVLNDQDRLHLLAFSVIDMGRSLKARSLLKAIHVKDTARSFSVLRAGTLLGDLKG